MSSVENTPTVVSFGEDVLERMARAVLKVQERLERSTSTLESEGIPYAIGGSNATSTWIGSIDASAIRQARNVELVLHRNDLPHAESLLLSSGFVMVIVGAEVRFLDGKNGKWRDAIEITFGAETVVGKSAESLAPDARDSEILNRHRVLRLVPLVEFQLARFRLDDAVDLHDMIDVGLVDWTWIKKLPPELAPRLQELLDNPNG